jgi:putative transposase
MVPLRKAIAMTGLTGNTLRKYADDGCIPQRNRKRSSSNGSGFRDTSTTKPSADNQGRVVAIDPGIRAFAPLYANAGAAKIGESDYFAIIRRCFALDDLISRMSKATSRKKRRLKKAADKLRFRIKNRVDELHFKLIRLLLNSFDMILLPTLLDVCEAYTSKTASWTGEIKQIGGAKIIKSGGLVVDRDLNGARGIVLRVLVDTPGLRNQACSC